MDAFNIQNYFKKGKTVVLTLRHGDDEGVRQWSDKETNDLMKQMLNFLSEFQNHRRRKKDVWEDVGRELEKFGYPWTPEDCRKKWSNMIRTFKTIEEQRQDPTGKFKRVKWPFYDSMFQLLSTSGADALPECVAVVQLLKNGMAGQSPSSSFSKKMNTMKPLPSPFAPPNVNAPLHASLIDPQQTILHLSHTDTDVISIDHHPSTDIHSTDHLESNLLFSEEPLRFSRSEHSVGALQGNTSQSKPKPIFQMRQKKRPVKRKLGSSKNKSLDDSTDNILTKFLEDTSKQNELMLEKMTAFHTNALATMQERNNLLREIRDSLQERTSENLESLVETSQDNDLGLHLGAPFSTNVPTSNVETGNVPQLVLSDVSTASGLSTFQLVQGGTVLANIGRSRGKTVITNLEAFSEELPDVSLLQPTLVSVVGDASTDPADIKVMASPSVQRKRSK